MNQPHTQHDRNHPAPEDAPALGPRVRTEQRIVTLDSDPELRASGILGEKAQKLLLLAGQGFNIPKFFVVVPDGRGELVVSENVVAHFNKLRPPLIARSSHPAEGDKHSFSGVLTTFPNIITLEEPPKSHQDRHEGDPRWIFPSSLTKAYAEMVSDASANWGAAQKYVTDRAISDFRPEDMNVIVMEQLDVRVFGMFTTSSQTAPNLIDIFYEIRLKAAQDKTQLSSQSQGGSATFNRDTDSIVACDHKSITDTLREFGRTAAKIHDLLGFQQIEVAATDDGIYVLQSRTINISDPTEVPRYQSYRTMERDLSAIGYGFFTLPILVVDALSETSWGRTDASTALVAGTSDAREIHRNHRSQLRLALREHLLNERELLGEYILVIKEASDIVHPLESDNIFASKDYGVLNDLVRSARVVIRGRSQNGVRHEDWDHVEMGGVTIFPSECSEMMTCFRIEDDGQYRTLKTGDMLTVLSNVDGAFVWPRDSQIGTVFAVSRNSSGIS